jgi:hypothetical protein
MAYSGYYRPKNPQKYMGDYKNIVYRSSWECKVMSWLDNNPSIVNWGSEELIIPYKSPVDGKVHRYFPDFVVKVQSKDGKLRTMILEVKPKRQTQAPKQQKRITKQYINEVTTWGVNQAKWKAATDFCLDRGWEFKILTEDHLGLN